MALAFANRHPCEFLRVLTSLDCPSRYLAAERLHRSSSAAMYGNSLARETPPPPRGGFPSGFGTSAEAT